MGKAGFCVRFALPRMPRRCGDNLAVEFGLWEWDEKEFWDG